MTYESPLDDGEDEEPELPDSSTMIQIGDETVSAEQVTLTVSPDSDLKHDTEERFRSYDSPRTISGSFTFDGPLTLPESRKRARMKTAIEKSMQEAHSDALDALQQIILGSPQESGVYSGNTDEFEIHEGDDADAAEELAHFPAPETHDDPEEHGEFVTPDEAIEFAAERAQEMGAPGEMETCHTDEMRQLLGLPPKNICQNCGWDIGEIEYEQIVGVDELGGYETEERTANYCSGCGEPVDEVLPDGS